MLPSFGENKLKNTTRDGLSFSMKKKVIKTKYFLRTFLKSKLYTYPFESSKYFWLKLEQSGLVSFYLRNACMCRFLMLQMSPTLKDTGLFACSCLILGADEGREDEFD